MNAKSPNARCHWAKPTLDLPYPHWLAAEDCPWSCVREETPRPLESTELCPTCPHYEPVQRPSAERA